MFEQDRVLVRLQQRVLREAAIRVCYLRGSFGRGTQDRFSDLNVVLVFEEQSSRDQAFVMRKEFVQSVLPYVPAKSFDADHIQPYLHIALYSNGAKVEFLYETYATHQASFVDREIQILKDSGDWAKNLIVTAADFPPLTPQPAFKASNLIDLDNRFWILFMDIYRQLLRGDWEKPFPTYLRLLYFTIPDFLALLPEGNPARTGLIQVYFSRDAKTTAEQLRILLPAYLEARAAIIRRYNLNFEHDQAFEQEIQKLLQRT